MQTQQDIMPTPTQQKGMEPLERELYLKQLCSTVGFPWEKLPVTRFAEMHEHSAINQLFFSLEVPRPEVRLNPNQVCSLKQMEFRKLDMKMLQQQLKDARQLWEASVSDSNKRLQAMIDLQREVDEAGKFVAPPMLASVEAVHREGKWKCVKVSRVDQVVEFIQLTDTILTWKDDLQKVNQQVNLGRFRARLKVDGTVSIHPFHDNVKADGYYHPHVKDNGWVCWGNAAAEVARAYRTNDFNRILGLIQVFLQEYNPASPYKDIMRFIVERGVKVQNTKTVLGNYWFPETITKAIAMPFEAQDEVRKTLPNGTNYVRAYLVTLYSGADGIPLLKDAATGAYVPLDEGVEYFDERGEALEWEMKRIAPTTPQAPELRF